MGSRADAANPMTKIDAIIAERDAEIAALRAELTGVIEGHKAATELTEKIDLAKDRMIAGRDAEIERLRQQVAELQAWKDSVPVKALRRIVRDVSSPALYDEWFKAQNWLRTIDT